MSTLNVIDVCGCARMNYEFLMLGVMRLRAEDKLSVRRVPSLIFFGVKRAHARSLHNRNHSKRLFGTLSSR